MQVRLFDWQVERLKSGVCSGAAVLRYATKRYKRGDFAKCGTFVDESNNNKRVPLVGYPIKSRFDIPDAMLRQILAWHWQTPDEQRNRQLDREIALYDMEIKSIMDDLTTKDYILESNE